MEQKCFRVSPVFPDNDHSTLAPTYPSPPTEVCCSPVEATYYVWDSILFRHLGGYRGMKSVLVFTLNLADRSGRAV
jgi:hypothetical protein